MTQGKASCFQKGEAIIELVGLQERSRSEMEQPKAKPCCFGFVLVLSVLGESH